MRNKRPILMAEDDEIDTETIRRAFRDVKIANRLDAVTNGEEALDYLRNEDKNPCLILLDLNMPRMNGFEFLKVVKRDDDLKRIPVVVITTSGEGRDKTECFNLGVAGYMVKPFDYQGFIEIVKALHHYWTVSEIPD
ncbi:MAG: response regulator [Candidatus Omnitrophica bacterium]|nr:response regulator [Candidatus Omnitrophota bacterium]